MRRACFSLLSSAQLASLLSKCPRRFQKRHLLRVTGPSASSHFSFSAAQQNEAESDISTPFVLKTNGTRISSTQFLTKVKEIVGSEVPDEEFIIPRSAFDALAAEYDELIEENKSVKDKYTRALADTENVRRRGQRQVEEIKLFAIQGFCKDLLEVADILDLAVNAVKKEEVESTPQLKVLHEGVEMTRTVLMKTFEKHGLKKLSPVGQKFDPNYHEAVFQVPKNKSEYEVGCVAEVLKIGYALHDRPIRAAKVGVVQSS